MRTLACLFIVLVLFAWGCDEPKHSKTSFKPIASYKEQESIFKGLMAVTNNTIPANIRKDSLAFLVLPVEASCPSCRRKVVKSIATYIGRLPANHFIIIAANGGRKTINSYFWEENLSLPVAKEVLFLDSTGQASGYGLYEDKPAMYFTFNGNAYERAASIPATVKNDLARFFLGGKKEQ